MRKFCTHKKPFLLGKFIQCWCRNTLKWNVPVWSVIGKEEISERARITELCNNDCECMEVENWGFKASETSRKCGFSFSHPNPTRKMNLAIENRKNLLKFWGSRNLQANPFQKCMQISPKSAWSFFFKWLWLRFAFKSKKVSIPNSFVVFFPEF